MKIIKRGQLPSEKEYQTDCNYCNTVFQFFAVEAKLNYDQRDGNFYTINCPVCHQPCTKNI